MKKIVLSIFAIAAMTFMCARIVKAAPVIVQDFEGEVGLGDSIPVELFVFTDSKATPIHFPLMKNYGSKVQLSTSIGESASGYEFVYWNVNGFIRLDLPYNYQFIITENMMIAAVYKPTSANVICFMDANKQLIDWQYVTAEDPYTSAKESSLFLPDKPGYTVSPTKWDVTVDFNNITADTFLTLQYVPVETPSTHLITVTNGTGTGTYNFDSIVTAVANPAPEGQYFSYWRDDSDNFVSILPTYSFTAYEDKTLIAEYDTYPTEDFPYATLSNPLYLREDKVTFVGQFYLPEGYELIEYGIRIRDFYDIDQKYQVSNLNPETGEFVATFDADWGLYANIYVTYIDPHDPVSLSHLSEMGYTALVKNHPIISEYGEGSSNNKWIEIYNPSDFDTIDLTEYQIRLYTNGSTTAGSTLSLSGTLSPGDVFTIANSSANTAILAIADITHGVANFNGDDAIGIFYEGDSEIIDVIGIIGNDPGTAWEVEGIITAEYTLVRNVGVNQPTSTWYPGEWFALPQDDISKLGYHENDEPRSLGYDHSPTLMVGQSVQLTAVYNPLDSIRDGVWDSSDDTIATVSADGLVTAHAEGTVYISLYSENYIVGSSVLWTITAPVMYSINASAANEAHGTVSASPTSVVEDGSSTISITPASGYYTDYITVNGIVTQLDGINTFTINNITSTQTVVVTFDALNTISASSTGNGTVSSSVSSVMDGGSATLTFSPAAGYKTDYLTINGGSPINLEGATSYIVSNITSDTTIVITFITGETLEKIYEFNFTTTTLTNSYNTGTYTVQNIITSSNFSISVARVAANTTTSVTGATKAAIISPRLGDSTGISFFEMDYSTSTINKIEFDLYYWNSTAVSLFTKIELQVYNSSTSSWDVVEDLKTYLNGSLSINTYTLTTITGTKYRIYAEGGKLNANDARLCIDNIKIYS